MADHFRGVTKMMADQEWVLPDQFIIASMSETPAKRPTCWCCRKPVLLERDHNAVVVTFPCGCRETPMCDMCGRCVGHCRCQ